MPALSVFNQADFRHVIGPLDDEGHSGSLFTVKELAAERAEPPSVNRRFSPVRFDHARFLILPDQWPIFHRLQRCVPNGVVGAHEMLIAASTQRRTAATDQDD